MKNTSPVSSKDWRHDLVILTLALVIVLGAVFGLALPCGGDHGQRRPDLPRGLRSSLAEVDLKAQPSGQLVMQASERVLDTNGNSWQVMAYKYPQGIEPQPFLLGFKGTSTDVVIPSGTSLEIQLPEGQTISAPAHPLRPSLDWNAGTFDAQYNLSTVWSTIDQSDGMTLVLATESDRSIKIPISSQMLEEWHAVATCQALLCVAP
jgi:hypothetical protein